jgi:branched-chain amino acid transport system substrate-binding protein
MNKVFKSILVLVVLLMLTTGVAGAATPVFQGGQEYVVQADDWLSKLADKNYGDVLAWPIIWKATLAKAAEDASFATIDNPNLIEVGQKLWLPDTDAATAMLAELESKADVTIKIGFMGPLTGGAAFLGQEQMNFAKMAVQLFNEETGFNIEVVEGDTEINPDQGKIVAERFIADDGILAAVGPSGSQVCEATQPVFEEAGMAHITPSCTRISLTDPGTPTFFRPIPHDGLQGPTDSYSTGLNDEVEAALVAAGAAVQRASVTQQDTDFSSLVTTIIAENSDVVFFPGQISSQLGTLAAQLREQGYQGTYFLADGGFDISWVDTAGTAAEGTYVSFFAPDPHFVPQARDLTTRYEIQFGEFGAFGGPAGLSARIAVEAIERCFDAGNLNRACVVQETAATNLDDSLLGIPVSFGSGNQIDGGEFFIFQVQDGNFVLIQ